MDKNPDSAPYDNPSINNAIDLAANYCAVTGLRNDYSQASITGHTQTALSWNLINLWYLITICTIPFLTPSTSADDYTVSNYFNLLLITVTSLSQSCPSTLSCPWNYLHLMFQWISMSINILSLSRIIFVLYSGTDILSDKSEINQDITSFLSTSLSLPTSIVILLLVPSCLLILTTSISDLKLNQTTTQSTLNSIQFGNLKFEDRYEPFRPYFITVLCKYLRWDPQLARYNRWKHR